MPKLTNNFLFTSLTGARTWQVLIGRSRHTHPLGLLDFSEVMAPTTRE